MKILTRVLAVAVMGALYGSIAIATQLSTEPLPTDTLNSVNSLGETVAEATDSHIDTQKNDPLDSANEMAKLEQCQIVLKKIDKLSIEIMELEQDLKNDYGNGASERSKRRVKELKVRSLKTQIKRYKAQAKEYCPEKYLRKSVRPKKQGAVKRGK